ncbi:MAG TPA: HEAT repeat domain-containing protein [Polyangiaceae bacterium]|nr:HEAT repeat domain-containing protein [Polyangiaceae bacterium]
MAVATVDPLLARLAVAATATERCALLERVAASEDPQLTYAITAVLDRSQLSSVRACATQALSRQPTSEARSWLLDLAEDPEPAVHGSALESLATRDDAARASVVEATHSDDLELRVSAVSALLKAKRPEGYAAAVLVLPSIEDETLLSSLLEALGKSHDPQALPVLEGILENASRESHLQAISAMGELGVVSAATRIAGLLEVGSNEEFSVAAEALNKLTPERITAELRAVLESGMGERQALALSVMFSLNLPNLSSVMRQQLASGDGSRASLVLNRLTSTPDPSLEAELVAFAERGDPRLRFQALQALSRLDTPNAHATVQRLASSLPDDAQRLSLVQSADEELEHARERRTSSLKSAANTTGATLFELAADPSADSQAALLRYLAANDLGVNDVAVVVEHAPASTVQQLLERVASAPASVRDGLMQGLGRRADPQFISALRASLRDPATHHGALTALVQLGDDSILPELQRLAKSDEATERALAVQLFTTRADPASNGEIERLASDPDPEVMSSALHALEGRSPELVARIAERALRQAAPEERASMLSSLSDLKASLSRPLLEHSLTDTEDSVAVQAIQSLGNLQGPTSAERLLSVVTDSSRSAEVRGEAARALRTLGGPLARANRALLDSLDDPEEPEVGVEEQFVCNN